jgi:hypothetical protein
MLCLTSSYDGSDAIFMELNRLSLVLGASHGVGSQFLIHVLLSPLEVVLCIPGWLSNRMIVISLGYQLTNSKCCAVQFPNQGQSPLFCREDSYRSGLSLKSTGAP